MHKLITLTLAFLLLQGVHAQHLLVDRYVKQGLENNLALRQKQYVELKSMEALKQARGLFYPSIDLNARYSVADGGRQIVFPVGDMLNPVYSTLNQMLADNGDPALFPTVENQSIPFLRRQEHETRLRLAQPLYRPELRYNYHIRTKQAEIQHIEVDRYKRELVKEIKTAYFNYLSTLQVAQLYERTRSLLEKNLQVNQRLAANQKVTPDAVYRAEAELSLLEQKLAEAEQQKQTAGAYFNFLLNQPLDQPIQALPDTLLAIPAPADLPQLTGQALGNRDELKQLRKGLEITARQSDLAKSRFFPSLSGVVDYGFQGTSYTFGPKDDYIQGSLLLSWNLFGGFQNRSVIQQARLDELQLRSQVTETESRIGLQVKSDFYALQAAARAVKAAENGLLSAEKAFTIVARQYEQGLVPQLQFLDARNTYTNAGANLILTRYDYFKKSAALEQSSATYTFNLQP